MKILVKFACGSTDVWDTDPELPPAMRASTPIIGWGEWCPVHKDIHQVADFVAGGIDE